MPLLLLLLIATVAGLGAAFLTRPRRRAVPPPVVEVGSRPGDGEGAAGAGARGAPRPREDHGARATLALVVLAGLCSPCWRLSSVHGRSRASAAAWQSGATATRPLVTRWRYARHVSGGDLDGGPRRGCGWWPTSSDGHAAAGSRRSCWRSSWETSSDGNGQGGFTAPPGARAGGRDARAVASAATPPPPPLHGRPSALAFASYEGLAWPAPAGVAAGIAVAVAVSRVLLNVHWLTDVLAGLALGWAKFAVCAIAFVAAASCASRPHRLQDAAESRQRRAILRGHDRGLTRTTESLDGEIAPRGSSVR